MFFKSQKKKNTAKLAGSKARFRHSNTKCASTAPCPLRVPVQQARAVNGAAVRERVITRFSRTKYPPEPTFSLTTVPRYLDYDGARGFVRRALSFAQGKSRKFVRSFTERSTRRSARRISECEWRI